jgi:hypothetical protein
MHKTRIRLYLCFNICLYMFQYVSIKRKGCTEHRTQGVYRGWGAHIGCSLSVHCLLHISSHPLYTLKWLMFMYLEACSVVSFRSWAAVKQVFLGGWDRELESRLKGNSGFEVIGIGSWKVSLKGIQVLKWSGSGDENWKNSLINQTRTHRPTGGRTEVWRKGSGVQN